MRLKTTEELEIMAKSGHIASLALAEVLNHVKVGVSLEELDKIAESVILSNGAYPSFKMVEGYSHTTCINVNEGVVHGIPNKYKLKSGDLVSVDLGAFLEGFHSDLSYTVELETKREGDFLAVGKKALENAIRACVAGNHLGDVSFQMQKTVENAGFTVSEELVGHGIGRELHEQPYVPCYGDPGTGIRLKEGMVFAIEIIYQKGEPELSLAADGWTLETADKSLSALFEKTVAVTKDGFMELTKFLF